MNKIEKATAKVAGLPDDAKKTILLKIRKGTDAAITLAQTLHVIEMIGGTWEVEAGFVPMKGVNPKTGQPHTDEYHTANPASRDWIESLHADYKAREIPELPSRANPGDRFVTNVSSIGKNTYEWLMFTFVAWTVVYGIRINMPDEQSALFLPDGHSILREGQDTFVTISKTKPYEVHVLHEVKRWLNNETDYKAYVCRLLDMEEHVPAAQRTRDNTGCCPVCFREMKLEPGSRVMVAHGFKRPHHAGYTYGNCYGVGLLPYELSSNGVAKYMNNVLLPELSKLDMDIANVETDALDRYPSSWEFHGKPIERGQPRFEDAREHYHNKLTHEREHLTRTIALYQTLVREWKPRELPKEGGPPRQWLVEITRQIT